MKIFAFSRPKDHVSEENVLKFKKIADNCGAEYRMNREYSDFVRGRFGIHLPAYDGITEKDLGEGVIMLSIGGDGTFLEVVHRLRGLPVPIAGVNTGRLGFLTATAPEELPEVLQELINGNYTIERRTMLEVEGDFGEKIDFPCALNEFTIHRHDASMVGVETRIDGDLVGIARGDGTLVATSTGSTAYSLSAGGPVLSPDCSCLTLMAIAPHNINLRPLVIPDSCEIELFITSRGSRVRATLDNLSFAVNDGAKFTVRKSKFSTFLVHLQNISFYDTLRNKLMWGADKRNHE